MKNAIDTPQLQQREKNKEILPTSEKPKKSLYLPYLDGLRGLAALYVVAFHICQSHYKSDMTPVMKFGFSWLQFGIWAVDLFIVLSGYCLTLPVVESRKLRGGLGDFFRRRALRILPPYYAVFLTTILLTSVSLGHLKWLGLNYPLADVLSHIFLVHNWSADYVLSINPVFWSIAVEWQIYFVFALLLLPLWSRYDMTPVFVLSLLVGYVPLLFLEKGTYYAIHSWYVPLFCLGMFAANVNFSPKAVYAKLRAAKFWSWLVPVFLVMAVLLARIDVSLYEFIDPLVGLAACCLLIGLSQAATSEKKSPLVSLLSHPWAVGLGTISYSLYLIHDPVLLKGDAILRHLKLGVSGQLLFSYLVFVPISIAIAYLFSLVFERPVVGKRKQASKAG